MKKCLRERQSEREHVCERERGRETGYRVAMESKNGAYLHTYLTNPTCVESRFRNV